MSKSESRGFGFWVLFVVLTGFLSPNAHATPDAIGTYVAKSTFIYLADASHYRLQPKGQAYLPAGTRFIAFDQTEKHLGMARRLILTEDGLWGYIKDSGNFFWNPSNLDIFINHEELVVIQRPHSESVESSDLRIWFTPSEIYPMVDQSEDGRQFIVEVDRRKIPELEPGKSYKVKVDKEMVTVIETGNMNLQIEDVGYFKLSIADNVRAVRKPCYKEEISLGEMGWGGSIKPEKWFFEIGVSAKRERKQIERLGKEFNVTRWYYTRNLRGTNGSRRKNGCDASQSTDKYRVTKKMNCDTQELSYSYLNIASNEEIKFSIDQENQKELPFDGKTGRIIVSCAEQAFKLIDYLLDRDFDKNEIPFIISRLAKFRNTSNARCSK